MGIEVRRLVDGLKGTHVCGVLRAAERGKD